MWDIRRCTNYYTNVINVIYYKWQVIRFFNIFPLFTISQIVNMFNIFTANNILAVQVKIFVKWKRYTGIIYIISSKICKLNLGWPSYLISECVLANSSSHEQLGRMLSVLYSMSLFVNLERQPRCFHTLFSLYECW